MTIPQQVLLQQPVILLDAFGKIAPLHLDFIDSLDCFTAVLKYASDRQEWKMQVYLNSRIESSPSKKPGANALSIYPNLGLQSSSLVSKLT